MTQEYILYNRWALGDGICITALVRDLAAAHGNRVRVAASGHFAGVLWNNNPYLTPLDQLSHPVTLHLDYRAGIQASNSGQRVHFVGWFHKDFEQRTGLVVPLRYPRGDLHLSPEEQRPLLPFARYWVVVAGGKLDMTTKIWPPHCYQEVIDRLARRGILCVQAGATHAMHVHPTLRNCIQMVGRTPNERDFFRLIYHAEGVVCPITSAMHIAAVFEKPCVVLAGGREEPWWVAYEPSFGAFPDSCAPVRVPHRFLHTLGQKDCCQTRGCWKNRTVALQRQPDDPRDAPERLCLYPQRNRGFAVPWCLDAITPERVVEAVWSYYEEGILPPPGKIMPSRRYVWVLQEREEEAPATILPQGDAGEVRSALAVWKKQFPEPVPCLEMPTPHAPDDPWSILDHPLLGGCVTICVLSWGDYASLLRNCLNGILGSVPVHRRKLRLALNQPSEETLSYVRSLPPGTLEVLSVDQEDASRPPRRKYPAMRSLFHDPERPLTTPYVVWFDDDTTVVDQTWLIKLARTIIANHPQGVRLYGVRYYHDLDHYLRRGHDALAWFRQAPWWKGRPLRVRGTERHGPEGTCIDFVAGWFWAIDREVIAEAGIPDERLCHNGGDIVIGAQVHQAGYLLKHFNDNKSLIFTPPREQGGRRGYSEPFPWDEKAAIVEEPIS